jgi:dienelactone hydrolase
MWNARGYAAISIAVEGQTDDYSPGTRPRNWFPHAWPGPAREGIYGDSDESFRDQWMYHAVADTILANSLLRSLPEVDADKVGIMGISWGGIITSTVIGIDTRFAFAIPTYGGGYLHEMDNQYGRALESNELFKKVWDPAIRTHRATMPTLWYSWPGDKHFSLDAQAATYRTAPGVRMVSLVPGMGHSHAAAWDRPESYDFADSVVKTGRPWCVQTGLSVDGSDLEVEFSCSRILNSATLLANTGDGHTGERDWSETDARLNRDAGGAWIVSATLPPGTDGWFVNVHAAGADGDDDGDGRTDSYGYKAAIIIASSEYNEIEDTRHPLVGNSQTRRDP